LRWGKGIRELARLRKLFGAGKWRKMKGRALVKLANGTLVLAEVHWYEAHGKGKRLLKIKRFLEDVQ
jgi:hypothetical protein